MADPANFAVRLLDYATGDQEERLHLRLCRRAGGRCALPGTKARQVGFRTPGVRQRPTTAVGAGRYFWKSQAQRVLGLTDAARLHCRPEALLSWYRSR